jgi:hypothetical protein
MNVAIHFLPQNARFLSIPKKARAVTFYLQQRVRAVLWHLGVALALLGLILLVQILAVFLLREELFRLEGCYASGS